MKAKELMTENPKTCRPSDSLADAIRIMKEEDCGIVPVTQGDRKVVGVVTDRDAALYLGERDVKPSQARIEEIMTTDLVQCRPEDDIRDVSRKMQREKVRRVLVVDDQGLRGVIATADLARAAEAGEERAGPEVERVMEKVSEPRQREL